MQGRRTGQNNVEPKQQKMLYQEKSTILTLKKLSRLFFRRGRGYEAYYRNFLDTRPTRQQEYNKQVTNAFDYLCGHMDGTINGSTVERVHDKCALYNNNIICHFMCVESLNASC